MKEMEECTPMRQQADTMDRKARPPTRSMAPPRNGDKMADMVYGMPMTNDDLCSASSCAGQFLSSKVQHSPSQMNFLMIRFCAMLFHGSTQP